ncbi:MAG: hypothetical protein IKE41_02525, partial [Clostridia bacterium]|nr:hypothetical protein [Clostridia bacterium]
MNKAIYDFSIINWFNFINHQEIRYKNLDLRKDFFSLYSCLLTRILNSTTSKFEKKYALECCNKMGPCSDENVTKHVKIIRKHFLWGNRVDFRFLLTLELLETLRLFGYAEKDEFDALSFI